MEVYKIATRLMYLFTIFGLLGPLCELEQVLTLVDEFLLGEGVQGGGAPPARPCTRLLNKIYLVILHSYMKGLFPTTLPRPRMFARIIIDASVIQQGQIENTQTICNPFPQVCINNPDATFVIVYFALNTSTKCASTLVLKSTFKNKNITKIFQSHHLHTIR